MCLRRDGRFGVNAALVDWLGFWSFFLMKKNYLTSFWESMCKISNVNFKVCNYPVNSVDVAGVCRTDRSALTGLNSHVGV